MIARLFPLIAHTLLWLAVLRGSGLLAAKRPGQTFTSALDEAIPLVPQAVWFYALLYLFPLVLLLPRLADNPNQLMMPRLILATWIATALAVACYLIWPLRFPYPEAPDTISGRFLSFVQSCDYEVPAAKCPAFHAVFPLLCSFAITKAGVPKAKLIAIWAVASLICLSAILTKQHLVIDVLAGVLVAWFSWRLAVRLKPSSGEFALR